MKHLLTKLLGRLIPELAKLRIENRQIATENKRLRAACAHVIRTDVRYGPYGMSSLHGRSNAVCDCISALMHKTDATPMGHWLTDARKQTLYRILELEPGIEDIPVDPPHE